MIFYVETKTLYILEFIMIIHDRMEEMSMIEIRFHGRGGQGAVTAAEILAKAGCRQVRNWLFSWLSSISRV